MSPHCNIICVTESHIASTFFNSQLFQPSDKLIYRKDRTLKDGGVFIALDGQISHSPIPFTTDCEIVAINVHLKFSDVALICYYRPPTTTDLALLIEYLNLIRHYYPKNCAMLVGNFNMPGINWRDPARSPGAHPFER